MNQLLRHSPTRAPPQNLPRQKFFSSSDSCTTIMSQRYSRKDKGKRVTTSSTRPPVKIPPSDNTDLIEDNKLTLIGRVTNPTIQKPIWVINWLIQYWNMEHRVTGRDLGPELFKFRFETEEDLMSVLRKGPYHYKRWMLMLQRWEPIISKSFPNMIPFWVRIHGLPLHNWNKTTVTTIGKELGSFLDDDVERGRVRVYVNGLENLEMRLPLQLPSGEVISVDLEYEKLEKHCFLCFSLRHEKDNCQDKAKIPSPARGMINQLNTLKCLKDSKKREDMRDVSRQRYCRDNKDSSRPRSRPEAQSRGRSQYIRHSDSRRTQRDIPDQGEVKSRSRDRRTTALERLDVAPTSARVESPMELERALSLLGFTSP